MISTAHAQKHWQIRGTYPNGNKLAFTVYAYDYFEAQRKANDKKPSGADITDIVLLEPKRKLV